MEVKVSVVMCTFNGEKYLIEQIESITNQTYPIYEIIIQDDCSTDGTWDILVNYSKEFPNLHIFRNERNIGTFYNFFSAFKKAKGDYIAISDQDDVWLPDKVRISIESLMNKEAVLVYSDSFIADSVLNPLGVVSISDVSFVDCLFGVILRGHTIVVKSTVIRSINNWNEFSFAYDLAITLAALSLGKINHINEPLTIWRRHSTTVSKMNGTDMESKIVLNPVRKNPVVVLCKVMKYLAGKKTVPNFKWFYSNFNNALENFKDANHVKRFYRFTYWYSKENLGGILIASFLFGRLENGGILLKIKAMYRPIYYYYQLMTTYFETFRTWH
jgi:glycosyltransferase involved in cell wall biosynthesis